MGRRSRREREIISDNLRQCRMEKYPGRGGVGRCAEALGISRQKFYIWQTGKNIPPDAVLATIAAHFDTTLEWFKEDHRSDSSPLCGLSCHETAMCTSVNEKAVPDHPHSLVENPYASRELVTRANRWMHQGQRLLRPFLVQGFTIQGSIVFPPDAPVESMERWTESVRASAAAIMTNTYTVVVRDTGGRLRVDIDPV